MTGRAAWSIRAATVDDASRLVGLGARTFRDTYAADTQPADLDAFVSDAYRAEAIQASLRDPRQRWFVATVGDEDAGFATLVEDDGHDAIVARSPVLLGHLYLERRFQGIGLGAALMRHCLDAARAAGHDVIWLGVWERNPRAIEFYRRFRFMAVGEVPFRFGRERHRDVVMGLALGAG